MRNLDLLIQSVYIYLFENKKKFFVIGEKEVRIVYEEENFNRRR